jgi:hypothetical protein
VPDTSSNVEFAQDLTAVDSSAPPPQAKWIGFVEAGVLAIVAVATAWSGYQASRWEGTSTTAYALYERYTVLAQAKSTLAGQDRLYDIVMFNGWVTAKTAGNGTLASYYERRFRPEYTVAFKAWMAMDPFHNPKAPPGPIFMRQYVSSNALSADRFEAIANTHFKTGVVARNRADDYVRVTVFLATVLFLTALSQRFEFIGPRIVIVAIAAVLLLFSMLGIFTLPRI